MEALVDEGKLRSIGVQDASVEQLTEVMGFARITPAVNSVEVHPGNRNDELLAFCRCQVSPTHCDRLICMTLFCRLLTGQVMSTTHAAAIKAWLAQHAP